MDKIIRPIAPEDLKRILSAQDNPKADMIKIALYTGLHSPHRFRCKVFEILLPGYSTHATRYTFIMQWVNLNLDLKVMARITDYRKGEVSVKQLQQEMDKFFYLEV